MSDSSRTDQRGKPQCPALDPTLSGLVLAPSMGKGPDSLIRAGLPGPGLRTEMLGQTHLLQKVLMSVLTT